MNRIPRPLAGECGEYYWTYINEVPEGEQPLDHLAANLNVIREIVASIPPVWHDQPFAEGEWTVKDILLHNMDTERILAYRALRVGRGDDTPLEGFSQDILAPNTGANRRTMESILAEYAAVRAGTLALLDSFEPPTYTNKGTASGHPLTLRAAIYIIVGHEIHHIKSLQANYVGRA